MVGRTNAKPLSFGSKLASAEYRIHFTVRFGGVHAFGYNCAYSEPIWMESGALRVHCWRLALADFGSAYKRQLES